LRTGSDQWNGNAQSLHGIAKFNNVDWRSNFVAIAWIALEDEPQLLKALEMGEAIALLLNGESSRGG
jgi:hypothetical protein